MIKTWAIGRLLEQLSWGVASYTNHTFSFYLYAMLLSQQVQEMRQQRRLWTSKTSSRSLIKYNVFRGHKILFCYEFISKLLLLDLPYNNSVSK